MSIEVEAKVKKSEAVIILASKLHSALDTLEYERKGVSITPPFIFTVEDIYLRHTDPLIPNVRMRKGIRKPFHDRENSTSKVYVTTKNKQIINNIEVNREEEIEIKEEDFLDTLKNYIDQGYEDVGYIKGKSGFQYSLENGLTLNIETVVIITEDEKVTTLGNYYEIEKLLPNNSSESEITEAQNLINDIFKSLNIAPPDYEYKPWSQLCKEALINKEKENIE